MRAQTFVNRMGTKRDVFEIEHDHHCDLRLIYHVPTDELAVILQPARRRQAARTVYSPLTLDFDAEGQMIGMQLTGALHTPDRSQDLDVSRALRPFRTCDNVTSEDQLGYVYVRPWDQYEDEDIAYTIEVEGTFDLSPDGGLITVRLARSTPEYEVDPFLAFYGLPWSAEVDGGTLNQFGL
jgi:hypothetical protein